ncbi:MAG: CpsB/CapC family capsule biosynthesis tyrosine phosphatase [Bacillota bacterium]
MGYIDIHTHILPGLDDGPATLPEALALAAALVEKGFTAVIATPHCFEGKPAAPAILENLGEINRALSERSIPLRVLPGAEHALEPQLVKRLQDGAVLTLNRGRCLLIELPLYQPLPPYTRDLLFELRARAYYPILAHPERVMAFQDHFSSLLEIVRGGAMTQLTLASLTGVMGPEAQRTAKRMLKHKLAHFAATDAHSPGPRLGAVPRAAALLEQDLGPGAAALLLSERPQLLLENRPVLLLETETTAQPPRRPRRGLLT